MKRLLTTLLTLCLLGTLAVPAHAATATTVRTEEVTITYRGIRITLDGVTVNPRDAQGAPVEPFILNGTTYLPVRAIANALSLGVAWDEETSTVSLTAGGTVELSTGKPAASNLTVKTPITYRGIQLVVSGKTVEPTDANGEPVEPFILDGTTYLPVRAIANALGLRVGWNEASSTVALEAPKELQPPPTVVSWRLSKKTETVSWSFLGDEPVVDCFTYHYDKAGNHTETVYTTTNSNSKNGGYTNTYTYNEAGVLVSAYVDGLYTVSYEYNSDGDPTKTVYMIGDFFDHSYTYAYDGSGRLASLVYDNQNSSLRSTTEYRYDQSGLLTKEITTGKNGSASTTTYTYDADGRLIRTSVDEDTYTYAYNAQKQMIRQDATAVRSGMTYTKTFTYEYDTNGNLIRETQDTSQNYHSVTVYEYEAV